MVNYVSSFRKICRLKFHKIHGPLETICVTCGNSLSTFGVVDTQQIFEEKVRISSI